MENSDKLLIIDEIEVEYRKLFNECKPKHEKVKAGLDEGLNILSNLKQSPLEEIDSKLKESIEKLISPIILIAQNKVKRIYITSLIVLQKIISYSLLNKDQTTIVIQSLGKICQDSSEEFVHQKIVETLTPLIDINILELKEEIIEIIMKIILKIFQVKGTSFKEPLTLLIDKLLTILCESITEDTNQIIKDKKELQNEENNNNESNNSIEKNININEIKDNNIQKGEEEEEDPNNNIKEEKKEKEEVKEEKDEKEKLKDNNYFIEPKFNLEEYEMNELFKSLFIIFKTACDLSEGKKLENVYKSIYTKCLGYEMITSLIKKTNNLFIYFP